ncbi:MAG: M23 family metallopeptidase [Treponema sp.]|jgi:murein DD-endopeptidase MepM/ murein hydrolase activator NlpD|nr:M23 family metallopeptidase [Treponema sp.]
MASVHEYKRLEDNLFHGFKNAVVSAGKGVGGGLSAFGRFLTRRYTVVFVPHSEKRVYNFHINVLSILCFLLVAGAFLGASLWYGASYNSAKAMLDDKDSSLRTAQASLNQLRDEVSGLLLEMKGFESTLEQTLSTLGQNPGTQAKQVYGGDLGDFFRISEAPEGQLREVDYVRRISSIVKESVDPLKDIGSMLNSQSALLTEIPSIWPIKNGLGHVSMYFGQNINPFSGQYYIHKGIDISTYRSGDPIVATADGQVVTIEYTEDFGNYVIIRHKHGYYTRYAHMLSSRVRLGQRVQQGEVIGYIGNTGLSTGPHLHYEIHIGSDVVDPYKYMNIRSSIAKQGR